MNSILQLRRILIVAPGGAFRQQATQAFQELGFQNIEATHSVESAFHLLEVEPFDWIFTPIDLEGKINTFQLLSVIRKTPVLGKIKVSILASRDTMKAVGRCFELGALSYHNILLNKNNLQNAVSGIIERMKHLSHDYRLVAADYIRLYLDEMEHFRDLEAFELALIREYIGRTENLLDLGKAQILNGAPEQGMVTLQQAALLDPHLSDRVEAIIQYYEPDEDISSDPEGRPINILGLNSAIIIEPNIDDAKLIAKTLRQLGVTSIKMFKNPFSAFTYAVKKQKPDLIVSEWSLPDFPAPILFQRLNDRLASDIPIIAVNRDLNANDLPQLQEMGVRSAIQKPLSEEHLYEKIIWIFQQERVPNTPDSLKRKIRRALIHEDLDKAQFLFNQFTRNSQVIPGDTKSLEAELALAKGEYEQSRDLAIEAMALGANTLEVLHTLGTSFIHLQEFDAGLKCLESANIMSPYNVGRLCSIAEAHMNTNNQKKYEDSIARARRISPDSKAIKELEAKNALRANQTEKAKDLMNQLPSLKNVVRFTNNRAVALIQCDRIQEGIDAYKQALAALPQNKVELRCIVLYNLGLAYARADNLEEALATLKLALISQDKLRRTRVKSLMKKVLHAKKSGEPLHLPNSKSGPTLPSQEQLGDLDQDIVYAMSLDPGENCCYRIFFHYQSEVPLEPYLNLKRPKFMLRESIKKEYALGLEKLMKAG